ncbi:zinc-ribbon domain-containing protein [Psychroserpens sp.]
MIFFGSRASRIKDGQINNVTCPNCENQTSMTYSIFGKYAHIYWIPAFPIGRENVVECNSCKRTFKLNELSEPIKQKFNREKEDAKTPIWYFSGIGIIAFLIALISYNSMQSDKENAIYIKEPAIGDVYSIKGSAFGYYSTMKVTEVTQDSVFTIISDYEVGKKSGVNEVDKSEYYTDQIEHLSKEQLISMYESETIYDIDRD